MYRRGLRTLIQPFSSRILLAQQPRHVRSYTINEINTPSISRQYDTRIFGKLNDSPSTRHITIRNFSDQCSKNKFDPGKIEPSLMATYEDIVDLPKHPEVLLIDVRQPNELAATGTIPTSINIPLSYLSKELKLSPDEFKKKYGRAKPAADSPIIFNCRIGVRSGEAAYIAEELGFTNVKNYVGSWSEYAEKNNLPQ